MANTKHSISEKFAIGFFIICMVYWGYSSLFSHHNSNSTKTVQSSNCSSTEYYSKGLKDGKDWVTGGNPIAGDNERDRSAMKSLSIWGKDDKEFNCYYEGFLEGEIIK